MSKVEAAARAHSFAPRLVAEDGGRGGGGGGGGLAPHRKSLLERTDERVAKRQHELFYGPPPRPPAGQPTLVSRATREGAELLAKVGADPTTTPAPPSLIDRPSEMARGPEWFLPWRLWWQRLCF